jgi:Rrf2 family protein
MRFSKMTDYTLLVLCFLQKNEVHLVTQSTLAKALKLKPATLKKTLRLLVHAQLIESTRGTQGGYRLAKPLESISMLELVTATEGPLAITHCLNHEKHCCAAGNCPIQSPFSKIQHQLNDFLNNIQLSFFLSKEANS